MNLNEKNASLPYLTPTVERIELDNEIALQLESTPPEAPGEAYLNAPEFFNNNPFKSNFV